MGGRLGLPAADGRQLGYAKPMFIRPHHRAIYPHLFEGVRKPLVPKSLAGPVGRITTVVHPYVMRYPLADVSRRWSPEHRMVSRAQALPGSEIDESAPLAWPSTSSATREPAPGWRSARRRLDGRSHDRQLPHRDGGLLSARRRRLGGGVGAPAATVLRGEGRRDHPGAGWCSVSRLRVPRVLSADHVSDDIVGHLDGLVQDIGPPRREAMGASVSNPLGPSLSELTAVVPARTPPRPRRVPDVAERQWRRRDRRGRRPLERRHCRSRRTVRRCRTERRGQGAASGAVRSAPSGPELSGSCSSTPTWCGHQAPSTRGARGVRGRGLRRPASGTRERRRPPTSPGRALAHHHRTGRSRRWFGVVATVFRRDDLLAAGFDSRFVSGEDIDLRWRWPRPGAAHRRVGVDHGRDRSRVRLRLCQGPILDGRRWAGPDGAHAGMARSRPRAPASRGRGTWVRSWLSCPGSRSGSVTSPPSRVELRRDSQRTA